MITEKESATMKRAEKKFSKRPPTKAELHLLAKKYQAAVKKCMRVFDDVEKVRGLDEFDPKHMAWETRLFHAENAKDLAKEVLLIAARSLA